MRKEYKISILLIALGLGFGIFLGCIITKLAPSTYLDIIILLLSPFTFLFIAISVAVHCQDWGNRYEIIRNSEI